MDAVLGLSVTRSAVGLVLVEGQDADGSTVDHEVIEILPAQRSSPRQASDEAAAAVLRAEEFAAARGLRLHTVGVTHSDGAQLETSLLLRSLRECGFDNVVPVQLPEASEALAWGVAEAIGDDVTAVCVADGESAVALVVHTGEVAVQTAVNHSLGGEESLISWLSSVFTKADWRPQALVLVSSRGDLDTLIPRLEGRLSVPVYAPAEAELALARGAALASTNGNELMSAEHSPRRPVRHRQRQSTPGRPLAMLAVGTVTFVASVSAALSMQLVPGRDTAPPETRPAGKSSSEVAAAPAPRPAAPSAPAALPPPPPAQQPPSPPPVELPAQPPALAADVIAAPPEVPVAVVPAEPALPPESMAPGLVPAVPTPVPERRGFLQRIRERLSDIGDHDPAPQQAPPPGPADPGLPPPPA